MSRAPLLVVAFQTERSSNGGVESLTRLLEGLLPRRIRVITNRASALTDRWRSLGFEVEIVPFAMPEAQSTARGRVRSLALRAPALLRGQAHVARALDELGARHVLFNDPNAALFGALGARLRGARTIFTLRATAGIERPKWYVIARLVDDVVSLSQDLERRYLAALARYARFGAVRARFVVIPSVVEVPPEARPRATIRAELGIADDELAVGVIGGVIPVKRTEDVVASVGALLVDLGRPARLHVLGDFEPASSPYAAAASAARDALPDPTRVCFHGYVGGIHAWYRALDLVVIGSDDEGLSRAMVEAMAHGVPVVSTDVCSARDVLEGAGAGVVVPLGDFEALARETRRLLEDASLRTSYGSRGLAYVAAHATREASARAYAELLGESPEPAPSGR